MGLGWICYIHRTRYSIQIVPIQDLIKLNWYKVSLFLSTYTWVLWKKKLLYTIYLKPILISKCKFLLCYKIKVVVFFNMVDQNSLWKIWKYFCIILISISVYETWIFYAKLELENEKVLKGSLYRCNYKNTRTKFSDRKAQLKSEFPSITVL